MMRFSKIWYWVVVVELVILAAGITNLFAQTNDVHVSEETKLLEDANKVDPATKVEPQPKDPGSRPPVVSINSATAVDIQRGFNELKSEYLDDRADYIDMWLAIIAIVLTFFGLVVVVLGYFGIQEFKRLKTEAKEDASEIKKYLTEVLESGAELERVREEAGSAEAKKESDEAMQRTRETLSAEVFATLSGDQEFEKVLRDFEQIPNLTFIDKAMVEAYKLQKGGKITEAIQKWRSIANIVDEVDKNFAARAWNSVGYLLSEEKQGEDAISAYDKSIEMKADYADAYYNRGKQKVILSQDLDAIEDLDKAINLNLDEAKVYVARGVARFELGKHDDAFTDFDRAIYMKPDYANAHVIRGDAKVNLNDFAGAKVDFQNALGLAKEQAEKDLIVGIEERLKEINEME